MKQKPLFISFEGCEGSGKSTQSKLLYEALTSFGLKAILTREPGGTSSAEEVRKLLLNKEIKLEPTSQLLLHFVARNEHVHDVILPNLANDVIVICDRYIDSTMAYQCYGSKEDPQLVKFLHANVIHNLMPNITFIMDVPIETSLRRMNKRQNSNDRYEMLSQEFHENVVAGFREIAASNPDRCLLIDGSENIEEVSDVILNRIKQILQ